jgi:hypothetical protein
VATKVEGLFRKERKFFTLDGTPLTSEQLAELKSIAGTKLPPRAVPAAKRKPASSFGLNPQPSAERPLAPSPITGRMTSNSTRIQKLLREYDISIGKGERRRLLVEAPMGLGKDDILSALRTELSDVSHVTELLDLAANDNAAIEVLGIYGEALAGWLAQIYRANSANSERRRKILSVFAEMNRPPHGLPIDIAMDFLRERTSPAEQEMAWNVLAKTSDPRVATFAADSFAQKPTDGAARVLARFGTASELSPLLSYVVQTLSSLYAGATVYDPDADILPRAIGALKMILERDGDHVDSADLGRIGRLPSYDSLNHMFDWGDSRELIRIQLKLPELTTLAVEIQNTRKAS